MYFGGYEVGCGRVPEKYIWKGSVFLVAIKSNLKTVLVDAVLKGTKVLVVFGCEVLRSDKIAFYGELGFCFSIL